MMNYQAVRDRYEADLAKIRREVGEGRVREILGAEA